MTILDRVKRLTGIDDTAAAWAWSLLFLCVPLSVIIRFVGLDQPLLDPHPVRHLMTAISTQMIAWGKGDLFRYHYPDPRISNLVYEFPLYQWIVAKLMRPDSLEATSRLVTLAFFFGGVFFLWALVRRLLSREAAAWAALLYVLSPYNIVYSRTGLLDFTFVFFLLGTLWATVELVERSEKRTGWWLFLTLFGITAALMKANMWAVPALVACGFIAARFFDKKISLRLTSVLAASFLLQALLAVAWTQWAMRVRGEIPGVPQPSWYVGSFGMRFELYRWKAILGPLFRGILHDWMVIPFGIGLVASGGRRWAWAGAAVVAINIVLFFHVHSVHDYYLVGSSPFVFIVVASGMVALARLPRRRKTAAFLLMAIVLLTRVPKLPLQFGHFFHDFKPDIAHALALKLITSESDLLFINGDNRDIYTLLVYAQRATVPVEAAHALANFPERASVFQPTVYLARRGQEPSTLLELRSDLQAIDLPGGFRAYRAKP